MIGYNKNYVLPCDDTVEEFEVSVDVAAVGSTTVAGVGEISFDAKTNDVKYGNFLKVHQVCFFLVIVDWNITIRYNKNYVLPCDDTVEEFEVSVDVVAVGSTTVAGVGEISFGAKTNDVKYGKFLKVLQQVCFFLVIVYCFLVRQPLETSRRSKGGLELFCRISSMVSCIVFACRKITIRYNKNYVLPCDVTVEEFEVSVDVAAVGSTTVAGVGEISFRKISPKDIPPTPAADPTAPTSTQILTASNVTLHAPKNISPATAPVVDSTAATSTETSTASTVSSSQAPKDISPTPATVVDPTAATSTETSNSSTVTSQAPKDISPTPATVVDPTATTSTETSNSSTVSSQASKDISPTPATVVDPTAATSTETSNSSTVSSQAPKDISPTTATLVDPTAATLTQSLTASTVSSQAPKDISPTPATVVDPNAATSAETSNSSTVSSQAPKDISPTPATVVDPTAATSTETSNSLTVSSQDEKGISPIPAPVVDPTAATSTETSTASTVSSQGRTLFLL
ncbi:Hypothetical predicted protein [Paramuricea clavata]|uniref:Uncharacterized protein n=1 Tax=Paramuricea clavata TaxID=317549 RepID=A0A6S7FY27_PARCT|nr:Hypothetical predicted protein [Paramuricea clavata]